MIRELTRGLGFRGLTGGMTRSSYDEALSLEEWAGLVTQFGYNGTVYTVPSSPQEAISPLYQSFAQLGYRMNGVIYACMAVRSLLFSEARFQFRQQVKGRPGNLFGTPDLAPLEAPWPGGTTGDLLARMIQHADLAGNSFVAKRPGGLRPLRPDWVTMIVGSNAETEIALWDADAEVVGYKYQPGGPGSGRDPLFLLADEVAHFAPMPDPLAQFRGMSWLTPVIREIMFDKAATEHKLRFMENAATPNLAVKLDVPDLDTFQAYVKKFREQHESAANAYKTLFLAAGADVTVVGANLRQMDFKTVQGAGETRLAAAAGVPPIIVGLSEGLQSGTYSNYEQAMERLGNLTMRPLWRNAAGSLARIIAVPSGAELWYDDRDIPALREDLRKAGERQQAQATAMATLIMAGYEPDSVTDAVTSNDYGRLVHTGLPSVQLQPGKGLGSPATNGAEAPVATP